MTKTAESTSQRLVSAVRKIAQEAVLKDGLLGPAAAKSGIGKTRGAAYYNANGDIESGSSVPGEAATDSADKSSAGNNGGSGSTKENLYSPIADADAAQVGDTFDQFEGYDCTTGDKIQLDLTPLAGAEYVPPDGWVDADTGPAVEGYTEGYFWYYNSFAYTDAYPDGIRDQYAADNPGYYLEVYTKTESSWEVRTVRESDGAVVSGLFYITRGVCSGGHLSEDYCTVAPTTTVWPSDGIASLILKNGTLQAHSMDPDAAEAFKTNPPSEIEICDGQGNRYSVTALEGGGAMITKLDAGGDPIADGRSLIIDSEGVVTKRVLNTWREGYL